MAAAVAARVRPGVTPQQDHPAWLSAWHVILTPRGAGMVLAALELARRAHQARDGGPAVSDDYRWLYEVCRIGAQGLPPQTSGRPWRADLPSSASVVTVAEAAAIRGVTPQAIRNAIKAGRLPAQRLGRGWAISEYEVRRHGSNWRGQSRHDPGRREGRGGEPAQRPGVGAQGRPG